ncbi:MAG: nucleotidyltransferase domain-containing protein [Calditrichaeota bacterium]|nr:nucleotidyltransferase domain-containing protein [Calditrichota bacterium]
MPVRSLRSCVRTWPDARSVDAAVRAWAREMAKQRLEVVRMGYFGSYARGDWGVGSDVDLIVVVRESKVPFVRRAAEWDTTTLPVPADVLVYTQEEWSSPGLQERFGRVAEQVVWVFERREGGCRRNR